MPNITIYLAADVERKVRKAAKANKQPVSRWISDQLINKLETGWPQKFLDLAGAIPDFPEVETLRSGYGPESPREELD